MSRRVLDWFADIAVCSRPPPPLHSQLQPSSKLLRQLSARTCISPAQQSQPGQGQARPMPPQHRYSLPPGCLLLQSLSACLPLWPCSSSPLTQYRTAVQCQTPQKPAVLKSGATQAQQQQQQHPPPTQQPAPPPSQPPPCGENRMNIVFVGAECAPWSKTGAHRAAE